MAHPDLAIPIESDSELMINKLCDGFSYFKGSTASNPEGLYHGHWKTLIKDNEAFEPYTLMIMFAFKFGEPPDAWTHAHQVMPSKDEPRQPIKINHIHHIQLLCAALNMGFWIIWGHKMMKQAATHGLISPYQFGARNGHMAISCVLLKCTSYDIIHLMWLVTCIFDNDATACYDHMIPSQCMIVTAHAGVGKDAIKSKLNILSHMKYYVKTAFGISTQYFTHGVFHKILGLLQGSADAGTIWSLIWSVLFAVLDKWFWIAQFPSPCEHIYTECIGKGFIDDTTLREISKTETIQMVVGRAEVKAQAWEHGIFASGGSLNLWKNFWHIISWKWWKNGQHVMQMKSDDPNLEIHMTCGKNHNYPRLVKHIKVNKGKCTLGLWLAPLGTNKTEHNYCIAEATMTWSHLLRVPLDHEKTRIGSMSMILSKFLWPLGAMCFSQKQCLNIQWKFMGTVLFKMGINRTTATVVCSGPAMYAGMAVPKLWPIQGSSKNKSLIGHLHKTDMVGNNLQTELDCLQLQAGTS